MNSFHQTGLISSPVVLPLRCKKGLKPLMTPRIEPLSIYSARNPAMPWLAAAIEGDLGDEDWASECVHSGAGVEVFEASGTKQQIPDKKKWGNAGESLGTLFSLMEGAQRDLYAHEQM